MRFILKKSIIFVLALFLLVVAGCGSSSTSKQDLKVIKIAASSTPSGEILANLKPGLAKKGIDLQIIEMSDYIKPNLALADKEVDANLFQHKPYLDKFTADRGLKLSAIANLYLAPLRVYSKQIKDLKDLPNGAIISIPSDPTNGGRALLVLEQAGVIKLRQGAGLQATERDIAENPKNVKIKAIDAAQLPRSLDDVAASVINTNFAVQAGLKPTKDAIFSELSTSSYINVLVVRTGDEDRPEIKALAEALQSPESKKFIDEKFKGDIIPVF
ncbi:MAG: MetQ/NlpA family ABC transporter substrate-binding protein [Negativicutes bacterium]|nr:MetQ/NlpA family ABC transporter substrate-binding protein [Negativicutes bacterium]